MAINMNRHVWEGWTVGDFITDLEPLFNMIMRNQSHVKPFTSKAEVKTWCCDMQSGYKKHIPEVVNYFYAKVTKMKVQ